MKTVKYIPETPETAICEKHGEYTFGYCEIMEGKVWVHDNCGKCAEEAEEKRLIEEAEQEAIKTAKASEARRIDAGISKRNLHKTFDDYICTNEGQAKAKADCTRYFGNLSDRSMLMVGGVGTGKTLLASAGIDSIIDKKRCEIIKVIDVIRELKATWGRDSDTTEEKLIKYYSGLDLLVLDEVGSQFGSDTEKLFIFDIIDGRYQNMKPTVLISNLDINGIKDAIGERCVDRLREGGGMMIAFDWSSQRN